MKVLTAVVTVAAMLALPAPAAADPTGTGWSLAFSDEFNTSTLDTGKWRYRTDVKAYSAQKPENVSLAGGSLNIALRYQEEVAPGIDFTGGGVVSKQQLRYGYYETRARINDGAGWHTAFWLQAGDGSTTFPAEQRTEIDVFEIDSIAPTKLRHNVITWRGSGTGGPYYQSTGVYDIGLDLRQWHTYGMEWSETQVKYWVDGVLKATQPYSPGAWTHDYTNVWLTSIGYGSRPDAAKLPSAVQFDYVRYWQKDYYVDNDGPAAYGYSETGAWQGSAVTGWTVASPTRYAACGSAGNTATWRPSLRAAGRYQVFAYKVAHPNSDPATRFEVAGATTVVNGTAGASGWVSLGTFDLPSGTGTAVGLTSSGTGCARADAVKFVRQP